MSSEKNEGGKEVGQYGELIAKLVGERLSYAAIAARIENDHGVKLSRQRVHQIAQSLGITSDASAMEKLRPILSDLLAMRELGKTLDEINDHVLASVGLDMSNSTLSRILSRAEEEKELPSAPLSELIQAMKPRWTSVAVDYHIDQVLTLRAQGYSLKQVCAMLKAAHGIAVEPSYLSHLLVKYGAEAEKRRKEAATIKKADGTPVKTRNSRWKNVTATKSHEAATINRLRARRQVLDESLAPVQFTQPSEKPLTRPAAHETVNHGSEVSPAPRSRGAVRPSETRGTVAGTVGSVNGVGALGGNGGVENGAVKNGSVSGASGSDGAGYSPYASQSFNRDQEEKLQAQKQFGNMFKKFSEEIKSETQKPAEPGTENIF